MENGVYKIVRIEGEYAYLASVATPGDELFIAMALLPVGVDIGSVLRFENFEFTLIG